MSIRYERMRRFQIESSNIVSPHIIARKSQSHRAAINIEFDMIRKYLKG